MRRSILISAFFVFATLVFHPALARAGMHFCNKTSNTVNVAMATLDSVAYAHVWGWWQVEPSACKTAIGVDLDTTGDTDYYYYAYDTAGGTWSDSSHYAFCIDSNYAFDYNDSQDNDCASGTRRHFKIINTNSNSDFTVDLTD
jgi:uncharacterized membrane protein